jgi:hypothetical protein
MSILHPQALFQPRGALVDAQGIPTSAYGRGFLQALDVRSGSGTGIVPIVSGPLTATGATVADSLQLAADWNFIAAGAANSGVQISPLLDLQPGNDIWVFNNTGNNKKVYPPNPQTQIDALGPGVEFDLAHGQLRCFMCWQATQFLSYGN